MLDAIIDFVVELFADLIGDRNELRTRRRFRARRPRQPRIVAVPDIRDLPVYEARHCLAATDLRMKVVLQDENADKVKGKVVSQTPPAGEHVRRRTIVSVLI